MAEPHRGAAKPREEAFEEFLYILAGDTSLGPERKASNALKGGSACSPGSLSDASRNQGSAMSQLIRIRRRHEEVQAIDVPDAPGADEGLVPV